MAIRAGGIDMRGGVRNVSPTRDVTQMPREYLGKATGAVSGRWALLHNPFPDASNVPAWLQTAILDTVQELGYPIQQTQGAGSDHAAFADAGIVATDIVAGGRARSDRPRHPGTSGAHRGRRGDADSAPPLIIDCGLVDKNGVSGKYADSGGCPRPEVKLAGRQS